MSSNLRLFAVLLFLATTSTTTATIGRAAATVRTPTSKVLRPISRTLIVIID